jgi:predicted nucleic acid-binding protein
MSDRFFLDTNIFVYSLDPDRPAKRARARDLIRTAFQTRKGFVSYQVVQEFFNVSFRRFAESMTPADAELYLAMTFRPLLAIHSSYALYVQALHLNERYSLSWYDSLIVAAAIESNCAILYTEDLQHAQKFGDLVIRNPFL